MVDSFLHALKANSSMGNRYKEEKNFHLQQKGNSKNFNKVPNRHKINVDKGNIYEESLDSFAKSMGCLSRAIAIFSEVQKEHMKVVNKTVDIVYSTLDLISGEVKTGEVSVKKLESTISEIGNLKISEPKIPRAVKTVSPQDPEYKRKIYLMSTEMRKKGLTWKDIAKELNKGKIPTPTNRAWTMWNAGEYCRGLQKVFGKLS